MKVTVCFGDVRVIVPCGDGDILVSELISKAISRYKKASGKPNDHYVNVHSLKSSVDGGLLDIDDVLSDVADDREQIIALYEEQGGPIPHNGGDGTSASSAGTASPDIFQGHERDHRGFQPVAKRGMNKNDVVVTSDDLSAPSSLTVLQVRRGSEPSLTEIGKEPTPSKSEPNLTQQTNNNNKRWPPMVNVDDHKPVTASRQSKSPETKPKLKDLERVASEDDGSAFSRFGRDSLRQSLTGSNMYTWLQAQEKTEQKYHEMNRREPLGGTGLAHDDKQNESPQQKEPDTWLISLKNEGGPLGIHVVPDYDDDGRDCGLLIQGIEPGGRIHRDGRLHPQDTIIEINRKSLLGINFNEAQEIFRQALQTTELSLRVVKNGEVQHPPLPKKPPPILPKPKRQGSEDQSQQDENKENLQEPRMPVSGSTVIKPSSPTKKEKQDSFKIPPAPPTRDPRTQLTTSPQSSVKITAPTNTKKIGKVIPIQLTKGPQGLGFSITTRDNPAGGDVPIYIKNILPKGAAIADGRLKSGDRLLEVNGIEMTGKSQAEAVAILRNTKLGSIVNLVISRQEVVDSQFAVPRELNTLFQPHEKAGDDGSLPAPDNKEILTFNIPLNETGSAGLGVSVKGKTRTTPHGTQDLGIFIKSVITGGAASKDGRLNINDQLIQVNGESLLGKMNSESMETLRNSMQREGPMPGYINLVVARRLGPITPSHTPEPFGEEILNKTMTFENFDMSENETNEQDMNAKNIEKNNLFHENTQNSNNIRNPVLGELQRTSHNDSYHYATNDDFTPGQSAKQDRDNVKDQASDSKEYGDGQNTIPLLRGAKAQNRQIQNKPVNYGNSMAYSSPTLNIGSDNTVMIDDEQFPVKKEGSQRPHSVHGSLHPPADVHDDSFSSHSHEDQDTGVPNPPSWLIEWEKRNENAANEADEEQGTFQREGFGRQSFSEKRRNDRERSEEIVLQAKKVREEIKGRISPHGQLVRAGSAESLVGRSLLDAEPGRSSTYKDDIGPTLGMRKSSSLESLQAMVEQVANREDERPMWKPPSRVVRGRGCNESFRAAVDHSYDAPQMEATMEALEEESSESNRASSRQSSFSTPSNPDETHQRKDSKKKKKSGLFSIFKFGKNRKALEDRAPKPATNVHSKEKEKQQQEQLEKYQARKAAQDEQDRIKEQYRKLQEKQRQLDQQQRQPTTPHDDYGNYSNYAHQSQRSYDQSRSNELQQKHLEQQRMYEQQRNYQQQQQQQRIYEEQRHYDRVRSHEQQRQIEAQKQSDYEQYGPYGLGPPQSRAERMQQLRSEHQKKHRERQGQYPGEEDEDRYEGVVKRHDNRNIPQTHRYSGVDYDSQVPLRPKRENYDRSHRVSYPATPSDNYSHYQNSAEIQEALQRHDYYQDRYQQNQEHKYDRYDRPLPHEPQYREHLRSEDSRGRSTPTNQMGYLSHHNKKHPVGVMNNPAFGNKVPHPNSHFSDFNDYDDPRHAYTEHSLYAKVQKRSKGQGLPGPAQV